MFTVNTYNVDILKHKTREKTLDESVDMLYSKSRDPGHVPGTFKKRPED